MRWVEPCRHNFKHSFDGLLNSYLLEANHNSSVSFLTTSSDHFENNVESITNLEIYAQPVHHPLLVIAVAVFKFLLIIAGEVIGYKLLKMIKQEQRNSGILTDNVLKVMIITQMTFWPLNFLFEALNKLDYPLSAYAGTWFCDIFFVIIFLYVFAFTSHSTVVAVMRYIFIVHEKKVMLWGKAMVKKVFLSIAILYPIVNTIIFIVIIPLEDNYDFEGTISLTKCYGHYSEVFINSYKYDSVYAGSSSIIYRQCQLANIDFQVNPTLSALAVVCAISRASTMIVASNFLEVFIYWRTFSHMYR